MGTLGGLWSRERRQEAGSQDGRKLPWMERPILLAAIRCCYHRVDGVMLGWTTGLLQIIFLFICFSILIISDRVFKM